MVQSLTFPVCQFPSPQGDDPVSFVLLVSSHQAKKREPFSAQDPPKRAPSRPEKERKRSAGNVLGLLVSMTNGFVCQLVCCFFN